jgi:hypothetical protein
MNIRSGTFFKICAKKNMSGKLLVLFEARSVGGSKGQFDWF